jgi:beta-barrel assembly-enhancing protease
MRWLAFLFVLFLTPVALADDLPDLGESAQADLPPQVEKRIGEATMQEIRRDPSYLDDAEISDYLNRLGHRLTAKIEGGQQDFEFFVLKDSTLNAFAMPGGYIGVHSGLIMAAQSESELASVLAHEISHVTQRHLARMVARQSQTQLATLLSMAVAILAARNNPDVAMGAAVAGQAAGLQQQLAYSRDFEREADRFGLQLLQKAGFDVRAMATFFERLQKYGRLYENNAPAYLRTHPLTTERIADMENRIQQMHYRQVADSLDFQLTRDKLKAQEGSPQDAITNFETQVGERKAISLPAARYGLARAYLRSNKLDAAEAQLAELRRQKVASPMIETLAAELRVRRDDAAGAEKILRHAAAQYPLDRAITYALAETLLDDHRADETLKLTTVDLQTYSADARIYTLQARAYALLGRQLQEHRSLAEAYRLQGQLPEAVEQLQLAQRSPDGDFYERSQVDARLREMKALLAEDMKRKKP